MTRLNKSTTYTHQNNSDAIYLENFLEMLAAERSAAKNTVYSYQLDLKDFITYLNQNNRTLDDCDKNTLISYISFLEKKELSARSLARKISAIKQIFKFLVGDGFRQDNPALYLEMPKQERLLPKALSDININKILTYIQSAKTPEELRNKCLIEILYSTGMRVSELIKIKLSNIKRNAISNDSHLAVIVNGKGDKERVVIFNSNAIKALVEYLEVRKYIARGQATDYLFPSFTKTGEITHVSRQRFHQIMKQIAIETGIEPALVSPHKLRHSFASHLLQNGADLRTVQELLGHTDISSTQIYTKILSKDARKLVLNAHPLAKKPA